MTSGRRIVALEDVPADSTHLFRVRDADGAVQEAILVRTDDGIAGWLNYCQHLTHIALDKGSGAELRNGELVCVNHGAYFEVDTGLCTHGPCEGARLASLPVCEEDGVVYLADDAYEYVGDGSIDSDDADLGSRSNVEF